MGQFAHLYNTRAWRHRRARQLFDQPLCVMCLARGMTTAATVADHVTPHRGDEELFFEGPLQSLCKSDHDSTKKMEESKGFSIEVGLDGWPIDTKHPVNRDV